MTDLEGCWWSSSLGYTYYRSPEGALKLVHHPSSTCLTSTCDPNPTDWEPQTELPRVRQGPHRPRRRDRLFGRLPPPAQHRVLLRQHQHGRLSAALHTGRPGVRLSGQTGLVNAPPTHPPSPLWPHVEELWCLPRYFHRTFLATHHCLSFTNLWNGSWGITCRGLEINKKQKKKKGKNDKEAKMYLISLCGLFICYFYLL